VDQKRKPKVNKEQRVEKDRPSNQTGPIAVFDRFSQETIDEHKQKMMKSKVPKVNEFEHISNPDSFKQSERLSKRLSRLGVCSRRQAERMMSAGMLKVDGKIVDQNTLVDDKNFIQISSPKGWYTPTKENTKIWLFHKPRGLITTHNDPRGRPTVFERLSELGLKDKHLISVGRLDFLSEGLMLITNDGELAHAMEMPSTKIERSYRVRIFGRMFNDDKLRRIKAGIAIKGIKYGPYVVEVENKQTTNTWLHMKLFDGKNNEIRRVMRNFSLRVNRLQRVRYGPYTLGEVPNPNDIAEAPISKDIRKLMYDYYRRKTATMSRVLDEAKFEKESKEKRKNQQNPRMTLLEENTINIESSPNENKIES